MGVHVLCVLACVGTMHAAATEEAPIAVDLSQIRVEGGTSAPATAEVVDVDYNGKSELGVKLVMQHRVSYHAIGFPVDSVDATKFNTLQFKVHVDKATGDPSSFGVRIAGKEGSWAATSFLGHAKDLGDGWYQFSWDMVNQPDNRTIDLSELKGISIHYGFENVPEGKTDTLTVIDMNLVPGLSVRTGDPGLYQQWVKYLSSYTPDYSDSSKYLLPPPTGRIAASLALTKDGKPVSKIVMPADASQPLTLAGNELQHWLKEISGADISIISAPDSENGSRVLLGRKLATGQFDKDIAALGNSDGFAVRKQGKNIYIFGATDKGTLNGVFAFLENNTDIIWPRPLQELNAVFSKSPDISAVWADALEISGTRLFGWGLLDLWAVRNRNNYSSPEGTFYKEIADQQRAFGNHIQFGGGHNIGYFLGKNPDFYPVIDGKKPEAFNIWHHQPNFTAPGIADAVAKNMLAYIKEKAPSDADCVDINIEDNWGLSTDQKSVEPITLPDGSKIGPEDPAFRSTQYFIFLNEVVKKINAVYPDMLVETYAYFFTSTVPKIAIDPHIRIMFAPYVRKGQNMPLYAPINDHWWQQMQAWSKATPNVVMREYIGILNGFRPIAEVEAADVRSYLPYGIKDYTSEISGDGATLRGGLSRGDDAWNFLAQEYWVINRIYWDPNQDVEQLRKYFIRRTFHEAAPQLERFFGIIRSEYYKITSPIGFADSVPLMDQLVIKPGHEEELRQLLTEAAAVAKNPTSHEMVELLRSTFDRWTAAAKDPKSVPGNAPFTATPSQQLLYGWQAYADWEQKIPAWAGATFTNRNGNPVPTVKMTIHPERNLPGDFRIFNLADPGLLRSKSGDVLAFTMNPATKGEKLGPSQLVLTATDKNGAKVQAPASAFTTTPEGGLMVKWKLESPADAAKPFDVAQIKELSVVIPKATFEGTNHEIVFYLTDWSLGNVLMNK